VNLKQLGKNAIWYFAGNVCIRLAGFLLIPLYTNGLSMTEYGVLCSLLVTIQMMTLLMGMATDKGFLRFASGCEDRISLGMLLGSTFLFNCAGALVVSVICVSILLPFFGQILGFPHIFGYVALACAASVFQALFDRTVVYYRAKHQGFGFLMANMPLLFLLIGMNFLFLQVFNLGVRGAILAQVLAHGCVWLGVFFSVTRKIGFGFSKDLIGKLLRFSVPLVGALAAALSLDLMAVYILGFFAGQEKVALYSLGHKIAQICIMAVIIPFQLAYEPFVYGNIDHPEIRAMISKFLTYLMLTYVLAAVAVAFFTRPLLSILAPPEYHQAYRVVLVLLPALSFQGVYYVGESLLGIGRKTGFVAAIMILCTLLAMPLYYFLVPIWGTYGAAGVFALIQILTGTATMVAGKQVFQIRLETRRLVIIGVVFLFLLALVLLLFEMEPFLYYTAIPTVIGTALYFLYTGGFADEAEKSFFRSRARAFRLRMTGQKLEVE
jgi:O-antigen/teichoic acid export membrane protein